MVCWCGGIARLRVAFAFVFGTIARRGWGDIKYNQVPASTPLPLVLLREENGRSKINEIHENETNRFLVSRFVIDLRASGNGDVA